MTARQRYEAASRIASCEGLGAGCGICHSKRYDYIFYAVFDAEQPAHPAVASAILDGLSISEIPDGTTPVDGGPR